MVQILLCSWQLSAHLLFTLAFFNSSIRLVNQSKMNTTALLFALGVVLSWGLYSFILRTGSEHFVEQSSQHDVTSARMKAFLFVGIAYVLVAVIGPIVVLKLRGAEWDMPKAGWTWSLGAGIAGALGAFFLLMALSSTGGNPAAGPYLALVVPTIVFAGAPIVNVLVTSAAKGLWSKIPTAFWFGVILAAAGMVIAMLNGPKSGPQPKKVAQVAPGYMDVTTRTYEIT